MRYTLWMCRSYACEAPTEETALHDATQLAAAWGKKVLVHDEQTNKAAFLVAPSGAIEIASPQRGANA